MPKEDTTYARTVVVPVSKPDTAPHMLELAVSLVRPETGRVIVLTISKGDSENVSQAIEDITPIVEEYQQRDHTIEMVTHVATTISRGILDIVREYDADILMIGVNQPGHREVKLGNIVENVIETAACDTLIYRISGTPAYKRVVVPIDGTMCSVTALRTGVMIARAHENMHITPLYIQRDYQYRAEEEAEIREILDTIDPALVDKDVIPGYDPAERILRIVGENDLLVIGFLQQPEFEQYLDANDLSNVLINRAEGPVLLASHVERQDTLAGNLWRQLQRYNPVLTSTERDELVWQAQKSAMSTIDYSMLIIISAALAALGLLLNSSAVIIGAMLVAPLMSPLVALSTGLIAGQRKIARRAGLTLLQGVLLALLISAVGGWVLPVEIATQEMLARGNPSLLDAAVALASGIVAAYATARKEIPAALAGVAIAAALMPPLCTVGLGLAIGNTHLAMGSGLLFLTNIVFIVVAESVVFLWLGMRPHHQIEPNGEKSVRLWWALISSMLVIVVVILIDLGQSAVNDADIAEFLTDKFPRSQYVSLSVEQLEDSRIDIVYTVLAPGQIFGERVAEVENELAEHLNRDVNLRVAYIPFAGAPDDTRVIITTYLENHFQAAQVLNLTLTEDEDLLHADVLLRTQSIINSADVLETQEALSEEIGKPLILSLTYEREITAERAVATATAQAVESIAADGQQ